MTCVIYRVYISAEIMPTILFSDGERHYRVSNGMPADVSFLRSGWDYMKGCLYVEYSNSVSEGEVIPSVYKTVAITPEYQEIFCEVV